MSLMSREELINGILDIDREMRLDDLKNMTDEEIKKLYNRLFEILRRLKEN